MSRSSSKKVSHLAVRSLRPCAACGEQFTESEFLPTDGDVCTSCWLKDEQRFNERQRQTITKELAKREAIARGFGNDRAVAYPPGTDYQLTRLLESLRRYSIKVRMVLGSEHHDEEDQVLEGHLRQSGPLDGDDDDFGLNEDRLGFFRRVNDKDCTHSLFQEDYARILCIDLFDELLLGNRGPVTLWTAPPDRVKRLAEKRSASFAEERRLAKWFVVHVAVLLFILAVLLMPAIIAFASGEKLKAFGWLLAFCVLGFIVGMSISLWEPFPNLSMLSSRRSQRGGRT